MYKENETSEIEEQVMKKKGKKKEGIYEPTREDIINLMHRMTGFSEDTIVEYIRVFKIKDPGKLTMDKIIYKMETLYFIERGLKIKKLMNKSK